MKAPEITQSPNALHRRPTRSLTMIALILSLFTSLVMAQTEAEMNPTDVLRKEHEIIRKVADALKREAGRIQKNDTVEAERIAKFHDFFKNFADRCHHAKEEDELFPVLREKNVDPVIIDLLVKQHAEGRILLAGIENTLSRLTGDGSEPDTRVLARYLFEYAQLMERHIRLENEYLWPRVSERLDDSQKSDLAKAFHKIETEELGEGFHEKYHALAMELLGKKNTP
ncbi:MAG: hemerythrin domain-containing protein [Kiritimatiellia bacterium]